MHEERLVVQCVRQINWRFRLSACHIKPQFTAPVRLQVRRQNSGADQIATILMAQLFTPSLTLLSLAAGSCLIYLIGLAIYRLYFSPIAQFPGPKLAALTLWYEFYFDVIQKGQCNWEIGRMHDRYGKSDPDHLTTDQSRTHRENVCMSCTSKTKSTTMSCTVVATPSATNGNGRQRCSGTQHQ